jgi:dolichol-phosphate mannosyltransferase
MRVSIIVPVFNEEDNIAPLAEEIAAACGGLPGIEILFVDDGSRDGTWACVEAGRARFPLLTGLRFAHNRGQSAALLAGCRKAAGDVIVTMDGDLQNDPADIPGLLKRLDTCDVVCGYRVDRKDTWSRRVGSRAANAVRNWFTHDGIRDIGCTLKAFRRECAADLPPLNGVHRFMPAYFTLHGRRIEQVPVAHRPRRFGTSKYTNLRRLPRTLFDLMGFVWYRRRLLTRLEPDSGS